MISKDFFRDGYDTYFLERLLTVLDGREKDIVIGELEEATWEEVRLIDWYTVVSPSTVFVRKLLETLEALINRALGEGTTEINTEVNGVRSFIEVDGYEISNVSLWFQFINEYSRYSLLGGVIVKIGRLAAVEGFAAVEGKADSAMGTDIKNLKLKEVINKHRLSDEALTDMGLTLPTKYMPARMRRAVDAAYVIKTYIDENLSGYWQGYRIRVENNGIGIHVVAYGLDGSIPIDTIEDVVMLTHSNTPSPTLLNELLHSHKVV